MSALLKHALMCVGLIVLMARADTLFVAGTVVDSTGKLVPNAVVTARAGAARGGAGGTAGAGLSGIDTTDATGAYSIVIVNDTFKTVTLSVAAAGARGGARGTVDTIAAPKDGVSDHVTQKLVMAAAGGGGVPPATTATGDSLIVTGTVTDSLGKPVDSATVTVRVGRTTGGAGGAGGGRGVQTGVDGKYTIALRGDSSGILTVSARTGTGAGGAGGAGMKTGSKTDTVKTPKDGTIDMVTANITIGAFVRPAAISYPANALMPKVNTAAGSRAVYTLSGRRISFDSKELHGLAGSMGHQTVIYRVNSENGSATTKSLQIK